MKFRLILHALLVPFLLVLLVICHLWLSEVVSDFYDMRINYASVMTDLITDNWDGITSITEEEKSNLRNNLNYMHIGVDIKILSNICFVFLYALFLTSILWALELTVRKYREET